MDDTSSGRAESKVTQETDSSRADIKHNRVTPVPAALASAWVKPGTGYVALQQVSGPPPTHVY